MNNIIEKVLQSDIWDFSSPFLVITGTFGVGKSFLIEQIQNRIKEKKEENSFIIHFNFEDIKEIENLPKAATCTYLINGNEKNFELDDLDFFLERFYTLKNQILNCDYNLYEEVNEIYKLKDYFAYDLSNLTEIRLTGTSLQKLETIFNRKSDIRIISTLFDVLTESILKSIFQITNKYGYEKTPYKIFLIFDNYENCSATIDSWIYHHLYKYLNFKSILDFKSYEIRLGCEKNKLSTLFDFKFILSSRYDFVLKSLSKQEHKVNFTTINLEPFTKEQCKVYTFESHTNVDVDTFYIVTQGIYYVIDLLEKSFNLQTDSSNLKELYRNVYKKIISRIPSQLEKILQFLSFLEKYSEEAIRCVTDDNESYPRIFKYFSNNSDLSEVVWLKNQFFKIKNHYQYFITNHIKENAPEKFELIKQTQERYLKGFEKLENLPLLERKILRNLAYFKEFHIGESLRIFFHEDSNSVVDFIKSNKELFIVENKILRLPEPTRNALLELNRLIDKERFDLKREYISSQIEMYKNDLKSKQKKLDLEIETLITKKFELEKQYDHLQLELTEKKEQLLFLENQIIDVKNKKNKFSKKLTWKIFFFFTLLSLISFVVGNNIIYFFDETFDSEIIRGLGISFKILSLLFLAVIAFLGIDYLAFSNNKKEAINRVEEHLKLLEKERNDLERALNQLTQQRNEIDNELQNLNNELKRLNSKKEEIEMELKIEFIEYNSK